MSKGNVLIADDDESVTKLFELVARKFGLNLVTAKDGTEAFYKIQNQDFDLVITDIQMPKMTGLKFIQSVRGLPKKNNYPFVVISATMHKFEVELAILDRVHLIEKPINVKTITQLFASKFGDPNINISQLDRQSISVMFIKSFIDKYKVLYEVLTKEKPTGDFETLNGELKFKKFDFVYQSNYQILKSYYSLYIYYDKKMAEHITKSLLKVDSKVDEHSISTALHKLSQSLLNKITESFENNHISMQKIGESIGGSIEGGGMFMKGSDTYHRISLKGDHGEIETYLLELPIG